SMDEKEVAFIRRGEVGLDSKNLIGMYELNGTKINIQLKGNDLVMDTSPPQHLDPSRRNTFRVREFSDQVVEFVADPSGNVTALKLTYDGKTFIFARK